MQTPPPAGSVLLISSQVGRGAIGGRAGAFALERLGRPVWLVPTVWMPWHPGHGPSTRLVPEAAAFAAALAEIGESGAADEIGLVLTGYFADATQVEAAAALIERLRARRPGRLVVVDPVLGDAGALYVPEAVATALRHRLLPLADVALPNAFELGWLTGRPVTTPTEAIAAARALGPATVGITSGPALMARSMATLLVTADAATQIEHPAIDHAPHGTGDLLAALFAARLAEGRPAEAALVPAVAAVFELVARSVKAGADELLLAEEQDRLVHPMAQVSVRRIAAPVAPGTRRRPVVRPTALD